MASSAALGLQDCRNGSKVALLYPLIGVKKPDANNSKQGSTGGSDSVEFLSTVGQTMIERFGPQINLLHSHGLSLVLKLVDKQPGSQAAAASSSTTSRQGQISCTAIIVKGLTSIESCKANGEYGEEACRPCSNMKCTAIEAAEASISSLLQVAAGHALRAFGDQWATASRGMGSVASVKQSRDPLPRDELAQAAADPAAEEHGFDDVQPDEVTVLFAEDAPAASILQENSGQGNQSDISWLLASLAAADAAACEYNGISQQPDGKAWLVPRLGDGETAAYEDDGLEQQPAEPAVLDAAEAAAEADRGPDQQPAELAAQDEAAAEEPLILGQEAEEQLDDDDPWLLAVLAEAEAAAEEPLLLVHEHDPQGDVGFEWDLDEVHGGEDSPQKQRKEYTERYFDRWAGAWCWKVIWHSQQPGLTVEGIIRAEAGDDCAAFSA